MKRKKQAILIMAHNNKSTVLKLLEAIDSTFFDIYLHIDKKSSLDITDFNCVTAYSELFVFKEIDVRWADYSQTETEFFLLKKALKNNYSYYHLISGNDFLIKTPSEIYHYFEENKKIYVHFSSNELPQAKINWVKYYHLFMPVLRNNYFWIILDKIFTFIQKIIHVDRIKKHKKKIMTGANWFSIPHNFAEYVVKNEHLVESIFKYTRSSDEMFIQTLLFNSPFFENLYRKQMDDDYDACKRFIKWDGVVPKVLNSDDFDEMINSNKMFARKVDEKADPMLINKIYDYIITKKKDE